MLIVHFTYVYFSFIFSSLGLFAPKRAKAATPAHAAHTHRMRPYPSRTTRAPDASPLRSAGQWSWGGRGQRWSSRHKAQAWVGLLLHWIAFGMSEVFSMSAPQKLHAPPGISIPVPSCPTPLSGVSTSHGFSCGQLVTILTCLTTLHCLYFRK